MRTKRIGVILAAAGLATVMGMAGCGGMGQTTEQLALPREGTEQNGDAGQDTTGDKTSGGVGSSGEGEASGGEEALGENGGNASADGIARQVQAPERYEAELSEEALTVRVDAEVVLPEGEGFKQYKVTGRPFAQEDLDAVKRVILKDAPLWCRDREAMEGSNGFTSGEIRERIEALKEKAAENPGAVVNDGKEETYEEKIAMWEGLLAAALDEPVIQDVEAVVPYVEKTSQGQDTWEENFLEGNATVDGENYWLVLDNNFQSDWMWAQMEVRSEDRSVGDAWVKIEEEDIPAGLDRQQIREKAQALALEMGFSDFAPAGEEFFQAFTESAEEEETIPGAIGYGIHFARVLDGIPVTYTHDPGQTVDGDLAVWPYESLHMVFDEKGLTDFVWVNPCDIEKKSDEDVFLMPFSDIQDIFEEMIFQKYGWLAKSGDASASFVISEVRLGYMRVRDETGAGEGSMVPVWDFFGSQTLTYADEIEAKIASGELTYKDGKIFNASGEPVQTENFSYVTSGSYESFLTIEATNGRIIVRGIGR